MIATPRRSAVNTNDMLGLLMRDLDRYPCPTTTNRSNSPKRVTAGDEEAKKQMVAANLRLVLHWARRYQDRGVEMVDLVQEGTFGLLRAVESSTGSAASKILHVRHLVDPSKLCNAPSSSTVARSASPSKSASSSSDSKRPPLNSRRSLVASRPTTS